MEFFKIFEFLKSAAPKLKFFFFVKVDISFKKKIIPKLLIEEIQVA